MIFVADDRVRPHLAVALRAHLRALERDAVPPPPDLVHLAAELSRGVLSAPERSGLAQPERLTHPDDLIDFAAAARRLGLSISTLRRRVDAGDLVAVRIGRAVRFRPADLDSYARRCTQ